MKAYDLQYRSIIEISGEDSTDFLQSLISNDITEAAQSNILYALILTPQGKILFDLFIYKQAKDLYLADVDSEYLTALTSRLMLYKLSSRVQIVNSPNYYVFHSNQASTAFLPDPRGFGFRGLFENQDLTFNDISEYHLERIKNMIPEYNYDIKVGEFFPHHLNMDKLNAISYTKGCYVGQEVVARSKHRAKSFNKKLYLAQSDDIFDYKEDLFVEGKKIGIALSQAQNYLLVMCKGEELIKLHNINKTKELQIIEG